MFLFEYRITNAFIVFDIFCYVLVQYNTLYNYYGSSSTLLFYVCVGFVSVYYSKQQHGRAHLSTPHSVLGAATVCYLLVQLCAGLNLLYPQFISKFVDLRVLRRMHGLSGSGHYTLYID